MFIGFTDFFVMFEFLFMSCLCNPFSMFPFVVSVFPVVFISDVFILCN